jgi:hypothetical protein
LAFEKQDWDFVSFLVCTAVFNMYYCFGYLFVFDFHCSYFSIGQFSWTMRTQIGTYLYTPISISVCYIILLGMRILIDTHLFSCSTIVGAYLRCTSINVQGT